jgi:hypothetical protein
MENVQAINLEKRRNEITEVIAERSKETNRFGFGRDDIDQLVSDALILENALKLGFGLNLAILPAKRKTVKIRIQGVNYHV